MESFILPQWSVKKWALVYKITGKFVNEISSLVTFNKIINQQDYLLSTEISQDMKYFSSIYLSYNEVCLCGSAVSSR